MLKKHLGILGLIMASFGTIILAISIGENTGGYATSLRSGSHYQLAIVSSFWFKTGLYLFLLGFTFQILEKIYETDRQIPVSKIAIATFLSIIIFFIVFIVTHFVIFY